MVIYPKPTFWKGKNHRLKSIFGGICKLLGGYLHESRLVNQPPTPSHVPRGGRLIRPEMTLRIQRPLNKLVFWKKTIILVGTWKT